MISRTKTTTTMSKRSSATATPVVERKTRIDLEDASTTSIPGSGSVIVEARINLEDASTTSIPGSGSVIVRALFWRNCIYSGCEYH